MMVSRLGAVRRRHSNLDQPRPVGPLSLGIGYNDVTAWVLAHSLPGSPFQRVRRTTVVEQRQPLQHSRSTHERVYVLPDQRVQHESQEVIAEGAQEALALALDTAFGGRLAERYEPGHAETVTADCAGESASPRPTPDGGCGASFLLCLACANARVHPGHHPRLALLHQQLEALRSVLPEPVWQARWLEHHLRLDDLRGKVGGEPGRRPWTGRPTPITPWCACC
ncbi:hypothetical protein ACFQZC_08435 [Streptacidiphilus monticola]